MPGLQYITFVVAGLSCGGIERAVVSLMRGLMQRDYRVSIVTFAAAGGDFFELPDGVRRISLDLRRDIPTPVSRLLLIQRQRLRALRAAIDATAPDVVVAHAPQINVPTLLATRGSLYPVIVTEHGDVATRPTRSKPWLWRKWLWYQSRRYCYRHAAAVVSVSEAVDRNVAWLAPERRHVIHNAFAPVDLSATISGVPAGASPDRPWLVAMGRLSHAKAHDCLLTAFASIAHRFKEWQLILIGDGELRRALQQQASPLGDQVIFAGAVANPFPLLKQGELFVMSSRYEGFPMAVGEALMCGLPVIATDCPSTPRRNVGHGGGMRELVQDGVNGILVPPANPAALAHALATCMSDPTLRAHFAKHASQAVANFALPQVLDKWEDLFRRVGAKAAGRAFRV
jgi:GalNAc-alpha-(1->4)-GalNAc-alpha-(1->3)-diNAcBac-PP-undecaprenol alpha-1,4-N-acetyl-D-galactosaminyltransferase